MERTTWQLPRNHHMELAWPGQKHQQRDAVAASSKTLSKDCFKVEINYTKIPREN